MMEIVNYKENDRNHLEYLCKYWNQEFWNCEDILTGLNQGTCKVWLAFTKEYEILGALVFRENLDFGEVLFLYSLPSQRKSGVGKKLLNTYHQYLHSNQINKSFLEVKVTNDPAISLYSKAGYQTLRNRPRYYSDGTDALEMGLDLLG